MDEWMDELMHDSINGWMDECFNEWMDEWMHDLMNEWMNDGICLVRKFSNFKLVIGKINE